MTCSCQIWINIWVENQQQFLVFEDLKGIFIGIKFLVFQGSRSQSVGICPNLRPWVVDRQPQVQRLPCHLANMTYPPFNLCPKPALLRRASCGQAVFQVRRAVFWRQRIQLCRQCFHRRNGKCQKKRRTQERKLWQCSRNSGCRAWNWQAEKVSIRFKSRSCSFSNDWFLFLCSYYKICIYSHEASYCDRTSSFITMQNTFWTQFEKSMTKIDGLWWFLPTECALLRVL